MQRCWTLGTDNGGGDTSWEQMGNPLASGLHYCSPSLSLLLLLEGRHSTKRRLGPQTLQGKRGHPHPRSLSRAPGQDPGCGCCCPTLLSPGPCSEHLSLGDSVC